MTLAQVTSAMQRLEITIAREQNHIAKFGKANDKDSDKQWEQYKAQAEANLKAWDIMKAKRDTLKFSN
jgi:hypothetical protein